MNLGNIINRSTLELEKAGSPTAGLDVRLILEDILKKDRSFLFAHPEAPISNPAYQKFRRLINRRKKGEPVAYLLGWKEFYGLRFKVNKNVLIPRPETEQIVEEAVDHLITTVIPAFFVSFPRRRESKILNSIDSRLRGNDKTGGGNDTNLNILDVGTGSGAIIISLTKTLSATYNNIRFHGSDISEKALKIARLNAKNLGIASRIKFYKSDLLSNPKIPKKLDVILANLPYIPSCHSEQREESHHNIAQILRFAQDDRKKSQDDIGGSRDDRRKIENEKGLDFEPENALFAEKKGLGLIEKLIIQISQQQYQPKLIMLEIFESHPKAIKTLVAKYLPNYQIKIQKDLADLNRLAIIRLNS